MEFETSNTKKNITISRKLWISIFFGLLALLFSPYGIEITWDNINIDLPWSIIFPLLVSLAFGYRYGIVASLTGGALFPFLLWSNDGWANLTTSISYVSFFIILGLINEPAIEKRIKSKNLRIFFALAICILIFGTYVRFVFNTVLSWNPPFWVNDTLNAVNLEILYGFFFKDSINLIAIVFVALTLLKLPLFCKLFDLPVYPNMKSNNNIFILTIAISILVWMVYVGLGKYLLKGVNKLQTEHITLALLVIITSGFIVAQILIRYSENQFNIQNSLYLSEEKFRKSIEFTPIPISLARQNGELVFCNRQFIDTYGYTVHDLNTLEKWFILAYPDEEYRNQIRSEWNKLVEFAITNNVPTPVKEYHVTCKNGEVKTVEISSFIEKDLIISSFQDITARKKTEYELVNAKEKSEESDRLKTSFLQNMSHEIRTPLNAICGFSDMLNKPDISEEKRKIFTSIIQNSSNQLLSIVTDILTISSIETKQEKLNIREISINSIIMELLSVFKPLAARQSISIYAKQGLSDLQSEILTDKTKITQVLTNLLSNALKFTHHGFVEFGYNIVDSPGIVSHHPVDRDTAAQCIQFYVKDTGIGIISEMKEKIFERFRQADLTITRKYGGTGLGLSISKAFVELLGGKIWVESEPGKGSSFYFTIPYKPAYKIEITSIHAVPENKSITILVAEDEEYNFLFIEELLIDMNLKLIHSKNGKETVEICKANPNINLILMDIKMSVMDGYTAAIKIKEFLPELPIIAQTAYALENEKEQFIDIFDDYITKPISEQELKQKIMKYIVR